MANIRFFGNITPQAVQFENASGTETGRIGKSGDDLTITNAVGDVLFGDGLSDVYIGNGISSVDLLFEQSGAISAAAGSSITLTIGSADTTLALYAPTITNISTQASESTALMINGSNVVGTRELGSNAFNSAAYLLDTTDTFTGSLTIAGDIRGNGQELILNAGESYAYATGQTNEYVYANAESGLEINSSPDNWATGWAGRTTATINAAGGGSTLPGTLGVGGVITAPGGSSTEWNDAYDNKIINFTDSGTSTVTLTLTQQDGGVLSTSFSVPQGTVTGGPYLPLAGGTMTGDIVLSDNYELKVGVDSDLRIYHNGTNNFILNTVGNLNIRNTANDGNITFQSDDGSGSYTNYFIVDGGAEQTQVYKDFRFQDSVKAKFGSSSDLHIYHDGSNSFIQDVGTGFLEIDTNGTDVRITKTDNEFMAKFVTDAQVELYYNGSKKLETTSTGVTVSGVVTATGGNSTEWNTAYDNRITSLTTTGTSGAATLISNVLNIPNYADGQGVTSILTTNGITGGPITTTGTLQVDSTVIRTTGNQTIGGTKTFSSTISGSINGNAATATVLQTARTIAGVSFNGSADINLNNNAITNGAGYTTNTGTVTGTGAATRVAFWNGTSSLTSDVNLYWDNTNDRLGIGTDNPSDRLHVASSGGGIRIQDTSATNNYGSIRFGAGDLDIYSRNGSSYGDIQWWGDNGTTAQQMMRLQGSDRTLRLYAYGSGNITGTATKMLAVTSAGIIVEETLPTSGGGTVTGVGGTAPIVSSGGTAPDISITAATTSAAGSMSAADKTKLNGIATGAQVNVGTNIAQGTRTTTTVPVTSSTGTNATLAAATTSLAGVMTSADKTKLDGIAAGANTGTVTSVSGTGTVSGLTLTGTVTSSGNLTLGGTLTLTSGNITTGLGFTPYNATNPAGYTSNTGDITAVTAGTNLNGGGTSGGVTINLDNDISLNTVEYTYPTSNSQFYGEIVTFGAFEAPGFAAGELICLGHALGNPTWRKANNTVATESTGMLGIALGSSPSAGILVRGFARSTAYNGFSDGGKCYISATDGDMTTTAPTATNAYLRIVGYVVDSITGAAEIYFCPDNTYVQIT